MEKGLVENGFIIDLSDSKNTTQLVFELSSIMEHPEVKGKSVCLKLGSIDLRQSQLLSIKALIESMDAGLAYIDTTSEQTEASAVSLGIIISKVAEGVNQGVNGVNELNSSLADASETKEPEEVVVKTQEVEAEESVVQSDVEENKVVEVHADITPSSPIETAEGVEDTFDEESTKELSEVIPAEHFGTDFETLATTEGLLPKEDTSKYILLDTGDVLPEGAVENSVNTENLPTLYINQTLRSGQTVSYEGNILIIGDAHPGSEIIAGGDITVWGILGGIAHAGSQGNVSAKVRALKLNAIQLRIAGLYARRNDTLNVPYVQKTNEFTPEEAQIEDGKIVIYKKLRRD